MPSTAQQVPWRAVMAQGALWVLLVLTVLLALAVSSFKRDTINDGLGPAADLGGLIVRPPQGWATQQEHVEGAWQLIAGPEADTAPGSDAPSLQPVLVVRHVLLEGPASEPRLLELLIESNFAAVGEIGVAGRTGSFAAGYARGENLRLPGVQPGLVAVQAATLAVGEHAVMFALYNPPEPDLDLLRLITSQAELSGQLQRAD